MRRLIYIILIGTCLSSCESDFLDKTPVTSLTEDNAFLNYDNFQQFMWPCYAMFSDNTIGTSLYDVAPNSCYLSDIYAGYLGSKSAQNRYQSQAVSPSASGNGWDFSYIRRINIMLSHLDDGTLTADEANHWRAVGYFFHSYWYMELINRFGDVPWVNKVLNDTTNSVNLQARIDRKIVADSVLARLQWAEANIDLVSDGKNTINGDVVRAALSRFALREGTWRKYWGLGDYNKYLEACIAYSEPLLAKYPSLYQGSDVNTSGAPVPATGYGELWTTPSLSGVPGVILYKESSYPLTASRFSDWEHIAANTAEMPKGTVDMYLCTDGKTISNSSLYGGDKDPYSTFRNRDPRLYHVVQPPFKVLARSTSGGVVVEGLPADGNWKFTENVQDREYIDIMGANHYQGASVAAGGELARGMKRLPTQNWGNSPLNFNPHLNGVNGGVGFQTSNTGFYVWKFYASWEQNGNTASSNSDFPIFKIEEVLLNYAECMWELGEFTQSIADQTINKLRARAGVANMTIAEIDDAFDPERGMNDEGSLIDPVLWEIRRERMVELMGEGFGFYDVRRWKSAKWYVNRQYYGMWLAQATTSPESGYLGYYQVIDEPGATPRQNGQPGYLYRYADPVSSGYGWKDQYYLYCVPTDELLLNPNLTQNPGWPAP